MFLQTAERYPNHPKQPMLYSLPSRSAELLQKDPELIRKYRGQVFEQYPKTPYAAEAYLTYYPYIDYMQGGDTLKHLHAMPKLFPSSPYTIHAYYLIGMDWKKDHKTFEGKSQRRSHLLKATEAFQEAESTFEDLYGKGLIPKDHLEHFVLSFTGLGSKEPWRILE